MMQFPGAADMPSVTAFMIGEDGNAESFESESLGVFTRSKEKKSNDAGDKSGRGVMGAARQLRNDAIGLSPAPNPF
jgi:hypothetical protein